MGLDPVCQMDVNPASAAAQSEYEGQTFYFCSTDCKRSSMPARSSTSTRPTGPRGAPIAPNRLASAS